MRILMAILTLAIVAMPTIAQEKYKPSVMVRLDAKQGADLRLVVTIENLGDQPITMRDSTLPAFNVWPWVQAAVDGKDAHLLATAAYAERGPKNAEEKIIPAKGKFVLGEILVVTPGDRTQPRSDTPILTVEPGEREIRIQLKEGRALLSGLDAQPASIKLKVGRDAAPMTETYKMVGDLEIKADVCRLPGDDVRPVVVWIHGGALITGQRTGMRAEQRQRYLNAGYVVVAIDYRLAPETKLKGIIEDVQDAFKWVREKGPKQFKADPKRVAVVGHSAGGYLTLMSGFAVEPRPQALIAFYGYGDIDGDWYAKPDPFYRKTRPIVMKEEAYKAIGAKEIAEGNVKGRGEFYMYCRQNGLWPLLVAGHDRLKEPRAFDRYCPIRNVTKEYPPTLLLHGDSDTDVPYEQSVAMAAELKKQGVAHDLISIKNGPHGFDGKGMKDAEVSAAFERVEAFLRKHASR
jgi:acetyl esterase/lipase